MNARTHPAARALALAAATAAMVCTAGAVPAQPPAASHAGHVSVSTVKALTLVIYDVRADIDGHSRLILTGGTARWHHIAFAAPGVHDGQDNPTIINGTSWFPIWPQPGENRDCNCHSSTFTGLTPPVPLGVLASSVVKVSCRDSCSARYADGTLILDFNDNPSGGDTWYEIKVTFWVLPSGPLATPARQPAGHPRR